MMARLGWGSQASRDEGAPLARRVRPARSPSAAAARGREAARWLRGIAAHVALAVGVAASATAQPNVLLIIADDLGVDRVGAYAEHPDPGHTPVIDQLATEGVLFRNAWSNPFCSPTRATLLTGRHSFRTGIGTYIDHIASQELDIDEATIPKLLPPGYRSAAVGKWHLSASELSDLQHPLLLGFEHHHGSISNLPFGDGEQAYFNWEKSVDGVLTQCTTYATTDSVDEALTLIEQFGQQPWFVWLAFNAPHRPYHRPPAALHTFDLPPDIADDPPLFMKAMTEATDTEMGRLFASMDPTVLANTVVIFVGDNGTEAGGVTAPFLPGKAKGTVYEGGVNVPLIITGPGVVQGAECRALVEGTDLFATVLELVGSVSSAEDSISLVPYLSGPGQASIRPWVYAERFLPNGSPFLLSWLRAVRDVRHKLIRVESKTVLLKEELYDLIQDPFEQHDLLLGLLSTDQQAALDSLRAVLQELQPPACEDTWCDEGLGLAGTNGVPSLQGSGSLLPGERYDLDLTSARPSSFSALILGASWQMKPFKGGSLVPTPDIVVIGIPTSPAGAVAISGLWPPGLPGGIPLYLQYWVLDSAAPFGASASNALVMHLP